MESFAQPLAARPVPPAVAPTPAGAGTDSGMPRQLWSWVNGLRARRPFNVGVAAVANQLARTIWAMLSRGEA